MFNINKMLETIKEAVTVFGRSHSSEIFYAFAIDANMLCLNDNHHFLITLAEYQANRPDKYSTPEAIEELRFSTGDWRYQGFFELGDGHGFDASAYRKHYYEAGSSEDGTAPGTAYAIAMTSVVKELQLSTAFNGIKRSPGFKIFWVDHTY